MKRVRMYTDRYQYLEELAKNDPDYEGNGGVFDLEEMVEQVLDDIIGEYRRERM